MKKALVIVESPAKIKTLKQFLGGGYEFLSSYGHIRDLPEKEFGIDLENNFEPKYTISEGKKKAVDAIRKAAKSVEVVYLSPDPDREGEAIAWHISEIIPKGIPCKRVTFHSITKAAVLDALKHPHDIDMALVNAQQARRLLDRIVGYSISPLLNKRLRRGRGQSVSAGRVQSAALKLVVDREREIEAFKPQEYWTIDVVAKQDGSRDFHAYLFSKDGKKIEKEPVTNKEEGTDYIIIRNEQMAKELAAHIKNNPFTVSSVEKKERKKNPEAPFITSTLQQEAFRHFRFSPSRTMSIAQELYEGVDLGNEGIEGLITYMRTDSVRIADEALQAVRPIIQEKYGEEYLPEGPRNFQVKKSAQDAHEAIRPTNLLHNPDMVEKFLSHDQHKLYTLIWRRFLACQMKEAVYDSVTADIEGNGAILRATGSLLKFPGFLAVYEEKQDETDQEGEMMLPDLVEGEKVTILNVDPIQSFTRPPPRYTEASLVKALEKSGIGRPSTYATIMNKIQSRDYTEKEAGRLKPTELGRIVTEMLEVSFENIVNIGFTREMEDELELVAEDKKDWKKLLSEFWKIFDNTMKKAEDTAFVPKVMTEHKCPKCGKPLQKIWFKSKYFLGCSDYPTCDFSSSMEELEFDKNAYADDFNWEQKCSLCNSEMKLRFGKFGPFLGCSNFPKCKGIVNIPKKGEGGIEENVPCPAQGCTGTLTRRMSRFGKPFYSCSTFPECDVIGNDIEAVQEKYQGRIKTAYEKKFGKNTRRKTMAVKKAAKKAPAKKKPAAKKKTAKK